MFARVKKRLNRALKSYGYRCERIVDYGPHTLEPFTLAVNALECRDPQFFVVQVGAHDGRRGDPLFPFIQRYRWRGLLLEPQPEVFQVLMANYHDHPQLILENTAIAASDGMLSMYTAPGRTLRATTDRASLLSHLKGGAVIQEFKTQAATFATLIERHHITRVDLMVVDTEGFDYDVVRLAIAAGLRPTLLRYEHLHLSTTKRAACAALLVDHGYALLRDQADTIAMPKAYFADLKTSSVPTLA